MWEGGGLSVNLCKETKKTKSSPNSDAANEFTVLQHFCHSLPLSAASNGSPQLLRNYIRDETDAFNGNKVLSILWPPLATVSQFLARAHASFQPGGNLRKVFLQTPVRKFSCYHQMSWKLFSPPSVISTRCSPSRRKEKSFNTEISCNCVYTLCGGQFSCSTEMFKSSFLLVVG